MLCRPLRALASNEHVKRHVRLASLGALCSIGPASIDMYLPAAIDVAAELDAKADQIALLVPSYLAGIVIGQLLHGFASDLYGRKPLLFIGLLIYSASSFACACLGRADWFMALRFAQGFGGSVGMVLSRAMIQDRADLREMARTFSLLMLVSSAAPLIAPMLGATLHRMSGWRSIFIAMGSFGVILLALCSALPETLDRDRRASLARGRRPGVWREILCDSQFIVWTLCNGLLQGGMYAYVSLSAIVLIGEYELTSEVFSVIIAAGSLGMVASALINARLIRGIALQSIVRSALWAAVASAVFPAVFFNSPPLPILLAAVFMYLSTIGFVAPNAAAVALGRHAERAGSASALLGTFLFGIGAASGAIAAHILHSAPTRALMVLMVASSALAALVFHMGQR